MLALKRGGAVAPQCAHDGQALSEARHPHARWVHGDAGVLVVRPQPARAHAELEAAARDDVERRRLLGQDDGMPEVVVEDERAYPQRRRGLRRHGGGDHGGPLVVEVVGDVEGRVAHALRLARQVAPRIGGCGLRRLQREAEGGHERGSYGVNLVR